MNQRGRKTNLKQPLWMKNLQPAKDVEPAPAHLGKPEQELWDRVLQQFGIEDPVALALLTAALEAAQRARECRDQIKKDGHLVRGKGGVMKPHPLLTVERCARQQTVATLRKLGVQL